MNTCAWLYSSKCVHRCTHMHMYMHMYTENAQIRTNSKDYSSSSSSPFSWPNGNPLTLRALAVSRASPPARATRQWRRRSWQIFSPSLRSLPSTRWSPLPPPPSSRGGPASPTMSSRSPCSSSKLAQKDASQTPRGKHGERYNRRNTRRWREVGIALFRALEASALFVFVARMPCLKHKAASADAAFARAAHDRAYSPPRSLSHTSHTVPARLVCERGPFVGVVRRRPQRADPVPACPAPGVRPGTRPQDTGELKARGGSEGSDLSHGHAEHRERERQRSLKLHWMTGFSEFVQSVSLSRLVCRLLQRRVPEEQS
jgi:hypothetical protein